MGGLTLRDKGQRLSSRPYKQLVIRRAPEQGLAKPINSGGEGRD